MVVGQLAMSEQRKLFVLRGLERDFETSGYDKIPSVEAFPFV